MDTSGVLRVGHADVIQKISHALKNHGSLGCMVFNLSQLKNMHLLMGDDFYPQLMNPLMACISKACAVHFNAQDTVVIDAHNPYCVWMYLTDTNHHRVENIEDVYRKARLFYETSFNHILELPCAEKMWSFKISVGSSFCVHHASISVDDQIMDLNNEALRESEIRLGNDPYVSGRVLLESLLVKKNTYAVFQPIVSLATRRVYAYEGLTRGPEKTPLHAPSYVLALAENLHMSLQTDTLFRHTILKECSLVPKQAKIFINVLPVSLSDPDFSVEGMQQLLETYQLTASHVVLEFSEKKFFQQDEVVLKKIKDLRDMGILIALDDVGTGYSGLDRVVHLEPSYLKVDRSLVSGIASHKTKQAVWRSILSMADGIGSQVIAEGIETKEELNTLLDLGVYYGQGYFLGRPSKL